MIAMIDNLLSRDSSKNHSHVTLGQIFILQSYSVPIGKDCNHIWSDSVLTLQSYLVPLVMKIAFILGPHFDHHCNHIWSSLLERLQSYLVPMIKIIAIICGPALYYR